MSAKKAQTKKSGAKQNKVVKTSNIKRTVPKKPDKQANSAKVQSLKIKPAATAVKYSKNDTLKKASSAVTNNTKTDADGKKPAKNNNPGSPGYILALKRKVHREIFDKCVEKKMLQEFERRLAISLFA